MDGDGDGAGSALIASRYRPVRCWFDEGAADVRPPGAGGGPRRSVRAGVGGELARCHRRPAPGRLGALRRVDAARRARRDQPRRRLAPAARRHGGLRRRADTAARRRRREAPVEPARRARRVGRRLLGEPARQVHPGQRVAGGRPDVAVAPPRHHAALDRGGLRQPAAAAGRDRRRHRRDHAPVGRRRPAPVAVVADRARPADLPRAGAGGAELAARRGRTRAPSRPGVPRAEPAGDAAHRRDVGADLRVLRPAPRRDGVAADGPSDARRHRPVHRRVRAGVGGRLRGDLRTGGPRRARARADGDAVVAAGEAGRHGARRAVTHLDRARRPRARALRPGGHRGEPQTLGAAAGSGRRTWSGAGRPGCRP